MSMGSGSDSRKSTHVMPTRKSGRSGSFGASGKSTGITGDLCSTNLRRKAASSWCCQGPTPSLPTNTAADLTQPICCSSASCHGRPGRSSHSSSQGRMPNSFRSLPICLTCGLSRLLWQRKTSNSPASRLLFRRSAGESARPAPLRHFGYAGAEQLFMRRISLGGCCDGR